MYNFIQLQYQMGKLTAEQVRAFAPHWITDAKAAEIVNTLSE